MGYRSVLKRAILIGAATGLRCFSGAAILSHRIARRHNLALAGSAVAPLANGTVATSLAVLSAGEFVADKLPSMGDRIEPGALTARAVFGAVAGAAVSAEEHEPLAVGAVVAAGAAIAAAFGGYHLRKWLVKEMGVPDYIVAMAEDAVVIGIGTVAARP